MNQTLLHHFSGIDDPLYQSNYKKIESWMLRIRELLFEQDSIIDAFFMVEEVAELLDYLLTYNRNVIRMGYSSRDIIDETNRLYDVYDDVQNLKNQVFECVDNKCITEIIKSYGFVFDEWHRRQSNSDSVYGTDSVNDALERYQQIINCTINGSSISGLHKDWLKTTESNQKLAIENRLVSAIATQKHELDDLYISIKKYQKNLVQKTGFSSTVSYISNAYSIDENISQRFVRLTGSKTFSLRSLLDMAKIESFFELYYPSKMQMKNIGFDEAITLINECFSSLSEEFALMIEKAHRDHWIDCVDRVGKMEGSYTNNIMYTSESIISMVFDGSVSDICKLSHEIGHAYHGYCVSDNSYFNTDFSVITAEAFGLFCENYFLLFSAMREKDPSVRQLYKREFFFNNVRTYIINLVAFYFEYETFFAVENAGEIDTSNIYISILSRLGIQTQGAWDRDEWIFRSQNFFPDNFYYNFVYIIGELLAVSMIEKILSNEISFIKISQMLRESGKHSVDSLFSTLGIDMNDDSWFDLGGKLLNIWNLIETP